MQWFREWESFVKGKDNGMTLYSGRYNCALKLFIFLKCFFYHLFCQSHLVPLTTVKLALWKEDTYNSNKVNLCTVRVAIKGANAENRHQSSLVSVFFSIQVQTMVRSQRRHGSTCWGSMAEAQRSQLDRQWPRLTLTAFMERGKLRQRPEHFEIRRGWNL